MDRRDLDWERLDHYVAGEGTPEELEALRRWVESSAELRAIVEVMRTAQRPPDAAPGRWDAVSSWQAVAERLGLPADPAAAHSVSHQTEPGAASARAARIRAHGRGRSASQLQLRPPGAIQRWRSTAAAAALVAAAVGLVLGANWWVQEELTRRARLAPSVEASREYVALRGERLVVHLSDQTQITLAPETRLRLSPTYGRGARDVDLEGQAYFVVTHDSTRPFSVRANRLIARDLGTSFVVRAYPGDTARQVVVAEGVVVLTRPEAAGEALSDSVLLKAGDLGRVTTAGAVVHTRGVSMEQYLAWTTGELRFRGTRLRDVVVELGRWYGVDVRLSDPSLRGEQVTASFRDEPAPTAIGLVASAAGLVVEQKGTQYTLSRKRR